MVDVQMPANQNEEDNNTSDSEEEVDDPDPWKSAFDSISGLMEPVGADENQPSIGVVLITVLDLMTKHKATDAVAKDLIALLNTLVAKENHMPTFYMMQSLLKRHMAGSADGKTSPAVEKIEVCVNMCIAFRDSLLPLKKDSPLHQHAHRTYCPECLENRYLDDRRTPRRVAYFLPCISYFQDLFMRPDLARHLKNNISPQMFPSGHIRRSVGWCTKVLDNPNINADARNQAVHIASDGVPLFKDKHFKNGEAIVMRDANLPDALNSLPAMCHLSCFVESKYKTQKDDGTVEITIRYLRRIHDAR